jgi:hypothetical protein
MPRDIAAGAVGRVVTEEIVHAVAVCRSVEGDCTDRESEILGRR